MKRLFLASLAGLTALGCGKKVKGAEEFEARQVVWVVEVRRGTAREGFEAFGRAVGANEVQIYSEFPGKLINYTVKEGERVSAGQVIAYVDRSVPGMEYEPYPVLAPVSGVVGFLFLKPGSFIGKQTPLATITTKGKVELQLDVPASLLLRVKPGMRVYVPLNGDTLVGRVSRVSAAVNPMTGAGIAKVSLSGRELLSGMVLKAFVATAEAPNALLVPPEAVIEEGGKAWIFVVKDGVARKVPVKVGLRSRNWVQVEGELREGDLVVTTGARGLTDGAKVEVKRQ